MAYGEPRFKASTKLIFVVVILAAVAIPIVGPFTFYGTIVPYLTPVLPKPEGVPPDAEARHNWKGPGLYWHWTRDLSAGCARWTLAEDRWVSVQFSEGEQGCDSATGRFGFSNFRDEYVDFNRSRAGAQHCSVHTAELSDEEEELVRKFLAQTGDAAKGDVELRLTALSLEWLDEPAPASGEHPCGDRYPGLLDEPES